MDYFTVDILTPLGREQHGLHAESLFITTADGEIEVLPNHMNLVTKLTDEGHFILRYGNEKREYSFKGGICKVMGEKILILTNYIKLEYFKTA